MKTTRDRIFELMNIYNINQSEFCRRTGLQKSAVSNYLNGDRTPRQDVLIKIADSFSVSPSWLMGYDVPMELIQPSEMQVSDVERQVIMAYRQADVYDQIAVKRILGIEEEKKTEAL